MRSKFVLRRATKQLSDTQFYQQIDRDVTETHQKEIISVVTQAIKSGDLPTEAKNLSVDHPRTSKFYMLHTTSQATLDAR